LLYRADRVREHPRMGAKGIALIQAPLRGTPFLKIFIMGTPATSPSTEPASTPFRPKGYGEIGARRGEGRRDRENGREEIGRKRELEGESVRERELEEEENHSPT
jgi:hypothetical protein